MRYCPVPSRSSRRGRSPSCSSRPSRGRSGAARTTLARLGREWFLTVVAVLAVLVAIRVGIPGESLPLVPVVGLAVSGDDDRNALEQLADDVETVVDQFADLDVTNLDRLEDWDWDWDRDWDWDCEGAQIRSSDFDAERSDAVGDLAEAVDELATAAADRTQQLAESERYRRAVHEITSDEDASSEEKIRRLLELGCDRLDLENGIVAHIDEETGCYEIEHAVGGLAEAGDETVLERTLCRDVVDSGDILTLSDVPEQGYADHPGYEDWDVDCYVGGRIEVDGELYGTVCFADPVPRSSFSGPERTFVDLVTRWVSHVFERREYERRLRLKDRALEAAPVGVTITDPDRPDNPIVYANEAFEDITGYTDSEWQGR
ncbi:GAF domain-containing protein, partial [Halobiforma nitratireducens]